MSPYVVPGVSKKINPEMIIAAVADDFQMSLTDVVRFSRKGKAVKARKYAYFLLRNKLKMKITQIAEKFGRDHTTIVHALQDFKDELDAYPEEAVDIMARLDNIYLSI